jgi:hypothetical protein
MPNAIRQYQCVNFVDRAARILEALAEPVDYDLLGRRLGLTQR